MVPRRRPRDLRNRESLPVSHPRHAGPSFFRHGIAIGQSSALPPEPEFLNRTIEMLVPEISDEIEQEAAQGLRMRRKRCGPPRPFWFVRSFMHQPLEAAEKAEVDQVRPGTRRAAIHPESEHALSPHPRPPAIRLDDVTRSLTNNPVLWPSPCCSINGAMGAVGYRTRTRWPFSSIRISPRSESAESRPLAASWSTRPANSGEPISTTRSGGAAAVSAAVLLSIQRSPFL